MAIVYRYIDNRDGIIKYVGITDRTLKQRVDEHKKLDKWFSFSNSWRIEYFVVSNKSQSEAWESHLIAFYKTYNWYNKAKKDWGLIPQFKNIYIDWKLYSDGNDIIDIDFNKFVEIDNIDGLISDLSLSIDFDIPKEDIWKMVSRRVICPVARTKNNNLLFIENDIDKVADYLRTYI